MRAYNKLGRTRKGRWYRLTVSGLSTQGAGSRRRRAGRYPGPTDVNDEKGGRAPLEYVDDQQASEGTISMLETLERHAYHRLTVCIDDGNYQEARQIVDLLKDVGII